MAEKMLFPLQFERQYNAPLDPTMTVADETAREEYLTSPYRYAGQIISQEDTSDVYVVNSTMDGYIKLGSANDIAFEIVDSHDDLPSSLTIDKLFYAKQDDTSDPINPKGFYLYDVDNTDYIYLGDVAERFEETMGTLVDYPSIPKGTLLTGKTDHQVLQEFFFPDLPPVITALTPLDTVYELGQTIGELTFSTTVEKTKSDITEIKITAGSDVVLDNTTAEEIKDGGTFSENYTPTTTEDDFDIVCEVTAGDKSATKTNKVKFARKSFYGCDSINNVAYTTSDEIRALSGSKVGAKATDVLTVSIPAGSKMVTIAVPNTLSISSAKYVEGMNAEVKDIFVKSTVDVEGANSYAGVEYNVYTYVPVAPYSKAVTYKVTLA